MILTRAISENQPRVVRYFLQKNPGFDLNTKIGEWVPLTQAAGEGSLEICRLLIEAGADPKAPANHEALASACSQGFATVTLFLLEKGADPNGGGSLLPLRAAIRENRGEIVRMLLEKGADPNLPFTVKASQISGGLDLLDQTRSKGFGAPIHLATLRDDLGMLELLLKHGADPNLAEGTTGLTALHLTVNPEWHGNPRALPVLLKAGAKPDPETKAFQHVIQQAPRTQDYPAGVTPLLLAIRNQKIDEAKLLIEAGASPKQPDLLGELIAQGPDSIPLIQLLLEAGCDPNAVDPSDVPPIMRVFSWDLKSLANGNDKLAKHHKQVELIQLLLKHGADPNTTYSTYTRQATRGPSSVGLPGPFVVESEKSEQLPVSVLMKVVRLSNEQQMNNVYLIKILLDAGAKPTHEFPEVFDHVARGDEALPIARALLPFRPETLELDRKGYFLNWNPAVKRLLLDEVLNPAVAAKGGVHLAFFEDGGYQSLVEAGASIPSTAELLLANVGNLTSRSGRYSGQRREPVLTRVRRDAGGQWSREAIEWNGDAPLPELGAGDIIEMSEKSVPAESAREQEFVNRVAWQFRKRVSFPVTLEIGGKSREIQLRGDLLVFDPTRNEAPMLSAGHLAGLFLPVAGDSGQPFLKPDTLLTVRREGSQEVRMDLSAPGALAFPLQAGDHLILPDPESVIDTTHWAEVPVQLRFPDSSAARYFGPFGNTSISGKPALTMPTLIQVIADAYASRWPLSADPAPESRFPEFSTRIQASEIPVILPHPDLSRIRIKRKGETQEVDLAAAIQRCTDDTPSEEVRRADVPLQPGDVVELPQKPGPLDQAWTGFSKEEERFFRKTLGGVVMIRKQDGIIKPVEISYQQAAWQQTPHGLIPLAPAKGVSSARLRLLTGMEARGLQLKRDGHTLTIDRIDAFVRDGDEIIVGGVYVPAPQGGRQPRPRMAPPTPDPR